MHVNKISLYDDKMTILCNTQDGHFDVDIKEVRSLKRQLAEMRGVTLPGDQLRLVSPPSKKAKAPSHDGTFAFLVEHSQPTAS